jgi:SAM-dependent methyltransferase
MVLRAQRASLQLFVRREHLEGEVRDAFGGHLQEQAKAVTAVPKQDGTFKSPEDVYASTAALAAYSRLTELFDVEKALLDTVFPAKGSTVLDLGCGMGRTSAHLHRLGYQLVACDVSLDMISQAKKAHPLLDFRVMDAAQLDFAENTFDCVWFSFNGIDHLFPARKRADALNEIHRVLKPGGLFVYSSTNIVARLLISKNPFRFIKHQAPYILDHLARSGWSPYWRTGEHGISFDFYMSPPFCQLRMLAKKGFVDARFHSSSGTSLSSVTLSDRWPHYSCRKPA